MKKKILFRADASRSLGTGDLVSLIHLSRYFEAAGWETHFLIRDYDLGVSLVKEYAVTNFLIIEEKLNLDEEVAEINKYIARKKIDVVFFEITERKLDEYSGITDKVIKACVNFDGIIRPDMDLVIDWDVDASERFDGKKYLLTKFFLGLEYVILPREFDFQKIYERTYKDIPELLLITMGGADDLNFTQKIIDLLIKNKIALKTNIIIGSGYRYKQNLEASLKNSLIKYEIRQNVKNIFDEFMNCDIAISAGGLTSFELMATRTPSILIATYEHQIKRCVYFEKNSWVDYLGFRMCDEGALLKSIFRPKVNLPKLIFKTAEIRTYLDGLLQGH